MTFRLKPRRVAWERAYGDCRPRPSPARALRQSRPRGGVDRRAAAGRRRRVQRLVALGRRDRGGAHALRLARRRRRARRRTDRDGDGGERGPDGAAAARARDRARVRRVRAVPPLPRALLLHAALPRLRNRARVPRRADRAERPRAPLGGRRRSRLPPPAPRGEGRAVAAGARMSDSASDTVVFIPAWNEEENLPGVLDDLKAGLPDVDVLVVDDGSTDRTAEVAREHGAEVVSLGTNKGLPVGIATGYRWALEHGYSFCGRVDADGQHPVPELARLLAMVRADRCDVAVGSRFVSGDGYAPFRYKPDKARRFGTAVLRRAMGVVLGRPFGDATSGLYAVNAAALPLLAEPFTTEAPEVEALIRITDAGLRLEEVPVNMAPRAGGESKLRGRKAVKVVVTVVATLFAAKLLRSRRRR